jgi:phenylalanyl-tRNA synthetase beta chain
VPSITPHTPMPDYRSSPLALRDQVREVLVGAGVTEAATFALVSPRHVELVQLRQPVPSVGDDPQPGGPPVTVTNPLSRDHSILRQSLIGSLLDVVSTNVRHGRPDVAIFEVGKGYAKNRGGSREWWRLGFVLSGAAEPPSWNRAARPYDLDDAKGVIELLCKELGFEEPGYAAEANEPIFHRGRTARVEATRNGKPALAAIVGELHPALLGRLELRADHVIAAEVAIDGLSAGQTVVVRSTPPSRHPTVERDLAIIVDETRPAAEVSAAIKRHGGPLLRFVALFDIYRGSPLEAGEKSLAERLTFADPERTLTESEVDAAIEAVTRGLRDELGARFRT